MQESFWWWQCSDKYVISLFPHLHIPPPPPPRSLISLMVSVDLKHHVYLRIRCCCEPVWPSLQQGVGKQRDFSLKPLQLFFLFKSCSLWTLSCGFDTHSYETLKWLSSLPILMQQSFWWWQCSDRYIFYICIYSITSLFLPPPYPLLTVPNKPCGFCGC